MYLAGQSGLLDINASFWIEVATFVVMILVLGRYVYPRIIEMAEKRQNQVAAELEEAEKARQESEKHLQAAEARLNEARSQAQEIVAGANRSGEQLRKELRERAEEEAARIAQRAREQIEGERQKAMESARGEIADLVVAATEKVLGASLDGARQRQLIDSAIGEVGGGERGR